MFLKLKHLLIATMVLGSRYHGTKYYFICVLTGRKSCRILLYECYSISRNRYEKQFDYGDHNSAVFKTVTAV